MVIYGGDDQTTDEVGGLGDLWIYSPRAQLSRSDPNHELEDEWQVYTHAPLTIMIRATRETVGHGHTHTHRTMTHIMPSCNEKDATDGVRFEICERKLT